MHKLDVRDIDLKDPARGIKHSLMNKTKFQPTVNLSPTPSI